MNKGDLVLPKEDGNLSEAQRMKLCFVIAGAPDRYGMFPAVPFRGDCGETVYISSRRYRVWLTAEEAVGRKLSGAL